MALTGLLTLWASCATTSSYEEDGSLPAESDTAVRKTLKRDEGSVLSCYRQAASSGRHVGGELVVAWSIARDGSAHGCEVVEDETMSGVLGGCVCRAIKAMLFPKRLEEARFYQRYRFGFASWPTR